MVTKCANPVCGALFQYLRGGKLFLVDRRQRRAVLGSASAPMKDSSAAEYFWLCEKCSPALTLMVDGSGRVGVVESHPHVDD